jgi:hypothetical protein
MLVLHNRVRREREKRAVGKGEAQKTAAGAGKFHNLNKYTQFSKSNRLSRMNFESIK